MMPNLDDASFDLNAHLDGLVSQLSLEDKVLVLTGRDFWSTWPLPQIGLRSMVVSDGPSGVRGERWDEREPSLNLPSASALSAAWNPDLARRYGAVCAVEARSKNVDVVLGPTINIHRSPLGGRHFEAFSEDPVLTAELAAAFVDGLQHNGVGGTPKHYVANDAETDRLTANNVVSERALREVYLLAFEKAITESHAWLVMSAYNSINGATATENELLETPLNSEWGFDGVVISDWTAVRSLNSARFSQDLVFPGPDGPWGEHLVKAVREGDIDESVVDRKVKRILHLAARVGALEGFAQLPFAVEEDGVALAREAASAGVVLVRNEDLAHGPALPLDPAALTSVAIIGDNAHHARTQGGGSATVFPERVVSPLEGLTNALPDAQVTYARGAAVLEGLAEVPLEEMTNPVTGEPGARVTFRDGDGTELHTEDRRATTYIWMGSDAPVAATSLLEVEFDYTAAESGVANLGCSAFGRARIWVDDALVLDDAPEMPEGAEIDLLLHPPVLTAPVEFEAGKTVRVKVAYNTPVIKPGGFVALGFMVGFEAPEIHAEELIAQAAEAARAADVAIVVVGTNARVESEGFDRTNLQLPGEQDALVAAVARSNPNTIVVVNSGAPVEMPWRKHVAAVVVSWFGGQEYGNALADVLLGVVEPGGRLPTTWPVALADTPVTQVVPVNGVVAYKEDIHVGYRAWLKAGTEPAYPFGHGLGYTTWDVALKGAAQALITSDEVLPVTVSVTNTGSRAGKCVPQVYLARAESSVDRPVRWLAGFAAVTLEAGESADVVVNVPLRAFAHWAPADGGGTWTYEPGEFTVLVGTSVMDIVGESTVLLGAAG
ncbi:MAG: glycosyl hydrolase [Actinobacteria bacterium HGW-Actinobacteria-4]|nr:MAG: glycosyl hydrolase [Actinobacteria bacterium HGW-Actinobacteria-4]